MLTILCEECNTHKNTYMSRLCKNYAIKFSCFPQCSQIMSTFFTTQQNSHSISHLLGSVTTLWLDSDYVVTVNNCRQSGDLAANGSVVTVLPAVDDGDYTVTVQSQCNIVTDGIGVLLCTNRQLTRRNLQVSEPVSYISQQRGQTWFPLLMFQ